VNRYICVPIKLYLKKIKTSCGLDLIQRLAIGYFDLEDHLFCPVLKMNCEAWP
jgi:hypothetical protein